RAALPLAVSPGLLQAAPRQRVSAIERPTRTGPTRRVAALDALIAHTTAVAVPLIAAGQTVGLIALSFDQARTLDGEERDFLLAAGRRTAEAYVRAQPNEPAEPARTDAETPRAHPDPTLPDPHR